MTETFLSFVQTNLLLFISLNILFVFSGISIYLAKNTIRRKTDIPDSLDISPLSNDDLESVAGGVTETAEAQSDDDVLIPQKYHGLFSYSFIVLGIFTKSIIPQLALIIKDQPTSLTPAKFAVSVAVSLIFALLSYSQIKKQVDQSIEGSEKDWLKIASLYFSLGYGAETIISDLSLFM